MPRPEILVVVAGTATGVGKTRVAAEVVAGLRAAGVVARARKPAQSFAPGEGPTDAEVLARAGGEDPAAVCPRHRWYEVPLAPPMAAAALGRPAFSAAELLGELRWPAGTAVGLVELVGGPASPLAADADSAGLARALAPDVIVLVADPGLGALNAVRLSARALPGRPVVLLNRYDPGDATHAANAAWLRHRDGLSVVHEVGAVVGALAARAGSAR